MFQKILNLIKRQPRWRIAVAGVVLAGVTVWMSREGKETADDATFTARRGPLQITVLEGGTLQAIDSQELKCEVRVGYQGTKILKIVDEGYVVTDEDVKSRKVLVELDSSELQKQMIQQEIQYQAAAAALADAQQGYDIQVIQNTSDILAAEQKARFARMDFGKFLGTEVASRVIKELGIDESPSFSDSTNYPPATPVPPTFTNAALHQLDNPAPARLTGSVMLASLSVPRGINLASNATTYSPPPMPEPRKPSSINFSVYTNMDLLGDGEAKQKLRKFEDDLQVAQKEAGQSKATLEGTIRLFSKGFVTRTDLQRDEIAATNSLLKVQTAGTARDLFLKYDLVKSAEETLSKYSEAMRDLEKAHKSAYAKLAQADARLKSSTAQYNLQFRLRTDFEQQIEKCSIRAEKPGLVIYGRAGDDMQFMGGEERVREGAPVRERQTILTIPDLSRMGVKVRIHETHIKKIKVGQKVRITVDAFADKFLEGEVTRVAMLPDSQNRWMNPDMKVYLTTIGVNGTHEWLKPGMSTKVEILVDRLDNVIYVPIQSVVLENSEYACFVRRDGVAPERHEVEVGQFNDEFIEVKSGLAENDIVLLNPPHSLAIISNETDAKSGATSAPPAQVRPEPARTPAPERNRRPDPGPR